MEHLHETLTAAVRRATGLPDAGPRPGQWTMTCDIADAMQAYGQAVGHAPTGTGKSLSYLVPAMLSAVQRQERTVISTESLSLQSQVVGKDAPVAAAAVAALTGVTPTVALLKGWSNYVCAVQVLGAISDLTGAEIPHTPEGLRLADTVLAAWNKRKRAATVELGGLTVDRAEIVGLLMWALAIHQDPAASGDRNDYTEPAGDLLWGSVSLSPSECAIADGCPLADACKPAAAKVRASEADIIVTNHAMLAVQAATTAPVVIGSRTLGRIDHLVVDEAHALPDRVRGQGAVNVSAKRVADVVYAYRKAMEDQDTVDDGWAVAEALDSLLCRLVDAMDSDGRVVRSGSTSGGVATFDVAATPLDEVIGLLQEWLSRAKKMLPDLDGLFDTGALIRTKRAHSKIESLRSDIVTVNVADPEHARWLELSSDPGTGRFSGHALKASPVDVAPAMKATLYSAPVPTVYDTASGEFVPGLPETRWIDPGDVSSLTGEPRYALSVTAVSATLAPGFGFDAGLNARTVTYPSPFAGAYAASMLYVPRASSPEDVAALTSSRYGGRPRFDTAQHPAWASRHIQTLVGANHGSALVLAATASAGRRYAADLRRTLAGTGIQVLSQWDSGTAAHAVNLWRADTNAVLVGTRSLMTGVDAPGETCSLVIIDRVPRAAGNPVDDARVRSLQSRADMDKWAAERMVYTSDAALLLEQAAGRLIRRTTDTGMLVVLDPRLLRSSSVNYPEPTRQMLLKALEAFPNRTAVEAEALAWLAARNTQVGAA